MLPFKTGDKAILQDPPDPIPGYWFSTRDYPFNIPKEYWNRFSGKVCTITHFEKQMGVSAVQFLEDGMHYFWPVASLMLYVALPSGPSPCDCPLNLVLSQGCKRKDHC